MTKRSAFRQADLTRAVRGALKAGLPAGSFTVEIDGSTVRILPIAANTSLDSAEDMERRMRDAFGR